MSEVFEVDELELCRNDLIVYSMAQYPKFVAPPHIKKIAEALERVERGECNRLMIFAPPRHGKSELVSKLFPQWFIGRNPHKYVAVATYGQDLSNDIGLAINQRMNSEIYKEIFPDATPSEESNSMRKTLTVKGGGFFVVGVGGALTGRGAHLRILDDPNKNREEANSEDIQEKQWTWWTSVFSTRGEVDLDEQGNAISDDSPIVIILTRWSDLDIAKRLIDKEKEDGELGDKWEILNLEAICETENDPLGRPVVEDPEDITTWKDENCLWPQKYNAVKLGKIKIAVGNSDWNALFQQRPTSAKGDLFLRDKWRFYDELPSDLNLPVQAWDMSYKETKTSDFVVGLVGARKGSNIYLIDRIKGRMNYPKAEKEVLRTYERFPKSTAKYIEAKANGQPIIDSLSGVIPGIIPVEPQELGSKNARWEAAAKYQQAGCIWLPKGAGWVDNFIEELASCPNGRYDDDADAFAMLVLKELGQPSQDALLKLYEAQLKEMGLNVDELEDENDPYYVYMKDETYDPLEEVN